MTVEIKLHHEPNVHKPMWVFYEPKFQPFLEDVTNKEIIIKDANEMFNLILPADTSLYLYFKSNQQHLKYLYLIMHKRKMLVEKSMDIHLAYFLHEQGIDIKQL